MDDFDVQSITGKAVLLVIYEFVVIFAYIFFSKPFAEICAAFQNINIQEVVDYIPHVESIFMMIMAVAGIIGIVAFIVSIFRSEGEWMFVRYR